MNAAQVVKQVQKIIRAVRWPDGSADYVVGPKGVFITEGATSEQDVPSLGHFVFVTAGTASSDPKIPGVLGMDVVVSIFASVYGDPLGQASIVGGVRTDTGKTAGRGVLEVEAPILTALQSLTGADGLPVVFSLISGTPTTQIGNRTVAQRTWTARILCTVEPEYEAPRNLVTAAGASGHAVLTWKNPSARFDFRRVILVRKAGATAPASVTDGTVVYTGELETFDDACGAGQFSWTIFASYCFVENRGVDEDFSPVETGTQRTRNVA